MGRNQLSRSRSRGLGTTESFGTSVEKKDKGNVKTGVRGRLGVVERGLGFDL
jgi:hypothetical protein